MRSRLDPERFGARRSISRPSFLYFAFFDAGGPLAGGLARLTSPSVALGLAAGAVASAVLVAPRRG
jgi:hypothetical protein